MLPVFQVTPSTTSLLSMVTEELVIKDVNVLAKLSLGVAKAPVPLHLDEIRMKNVGSDGGGVPLSKIMGYITQGRGVTIHRVDCGNALDLNQKHPERIIEVSWGSSESAAYPVDLTLRAYDRSGLLRDISSILADEKANVTDLATHTDTKSMESVMEISLMIKDLPTLSTTINRLEQLPNVISVQRKV